MFVQSVGKRSCVVTSSKRSLSLWPFSHSAAPAPSTVTQSTAIPSTEPAAVPISDANGSVESLQKLSGVSFPPNGKIATQTPIADSSLFTDGSLSPFTLDPLPLLSQLPITEVSKIGDLKLLGLCNNTFPGIVERLVEFVHVYSGLPWFGTIIGSTILIRIIFMYPAMLAQKNAAIISKLKPQTDALMEHVKLAQKQKNQKLMQSKTAEILSIWKKNKAHPMKSLIGLVQTPFFFAMFYATKKMAELPVPGFTEGGPDLLLNLSAAPPIYLPIFASMTMLVVFETASKKGGMGHMISGSVKTVIRVGAFASIVFTRSLPTAIFLYMITSNLFTIFQGYAFSKLKIVPEPQKTVSLSRPNGGIYLHSKLSVFDAFACLKRVKKNVVGHKLVSPQQNPKSLPE